MLLTSLIPAALIAQGLALPSAFPEERVSILLIGDSHTVGTFGKTLDTLLRAVPNSAVHTVGSCGMSPDAFLRGYETPCGYLEYDWELRETSATKHPTPLIGALLERLKPGTVIVALGANQINTAMTNPAKARADIETLSQAIASSGARCVWVGPPNGRNKPLDKETNLYTILMEATAGRCELFDSRVGKLPYLSYDAISREAGIAGDGAHYDALGAKGRAALRRFALDVYRAVF